MGSSNINSDYYVLNITNENIYRDIYKIFYTILTNNITPTGNRFWYSAFPDIDIDDSNDYPIGVINSANLNYENHTQTKDNIPSTIEIEMFFTSAESIDEYASDVLYVLNSNKHYLRKLGIKNFKLQSDDSDMAMRDRIKIHSKSLVFEFNIIKNKVSLSW